MSRSQTKRLVVISDTHCGHKYGLTPPEWQTEGHQKSLWKLFVARASKAKPDVLLINGDAIEGKGSRNGGIELITTDRHEQGDMAKRCFDVFGAKKILMTFGTPYHTGPDENFERPLADKLDAHIENRLLFEVNGLRFDVRHHSPGSATPYGPVASLQREKVMALLDARVRRGDVVVRSHVHKLFCVKDHHGMVITTPCFQTHTEYGARSCNGDIDLGFVVFDIKNQNEWGWAYWEVAVEEFRQAPMQL